MQRMSKNDGAVILLENTINTAESTNPEKDKTKGVKSLQVVDSRDQAKARRKVWILLVCTIKFFIFLSRFPSIYF